MKSGHQKTTKAVAKTKDGTSQGVLQQEQYQGPIPHPDLLKKFDETVPGAANRILVMAENEQNHRHGMEEKIILSDISLKKTGHVIGAVLTFSFLGAGVYLLINDKSLIGFGAMLTPVATLIGTFIYSKKSDEKGLNKK